MQGKNFIATFYLIGLAYTLPSFAPHGENAPQSISPAASKLKITPATIPDGKYGSAYKDQRLKVTGGKGSYSFSVSGGSLPQGISLSGDGTLSGAPTAAGKSSFTVTARATKDSTSQDYTLIIAQAPLTIAANNATTTYGSVTPALTASYNGFVNGDDVSHLTTPAGVTTTATSSSSAGAYPIAVSGAASPNYSFTYRAGTLNINPAALAVTANAETKEYGAPDPALTYASSGFVNGNGTEVFTGQLSRAPGEAVGKYAITKGNLSAGRNYTIGFTGGTLTISPASEAKKLKISPASLPNGQYGSAYKTQNLKVTGGDGSYTFAVSKDSLPPGLSLSSDGALSGTPTAAGTYPFTVTATGPSGASDTASQVYTLIIDQAQLSITAANATITYGAAIPQLTASYTGFVNGDNASNLTTPPAITTTATSSSPAGTYPITVAGAASMNYKITYNAGTLTINSAALAVIANAQTKTAGTADPPLTYTASGFVNGDNTGVFTGSLSRAAGEAVGTYAITKGSLSAGRNYTINFTGNYLTITASTTPPPGQQDQKITWTQSLLVGCNASTRFQLTATASSGLPVTYSVADSSIATVSGNTLTLLRPGSTVITANQPGDNRHNAAQPVTDTLLYQSASLIRQHWNDVIIFDNSSGNFVQWQWYKNGEEIAGATSPYYSETPALKGNYYVIATNAAGQQIQTCALTITGDTLVSTGIKVQPNPVSAGAVVTVTNSYTPSALQGAILQVIDLNGKVWQQITSVQPSMQVTMPSGHGIYIIRLLLTNGQMATTNALVLN